MYPYRLQVKSIYLYKKIQSMSGRIFLRISIISYQILYTDCDNISNSKYESYIPTIKNELFRNQKKKLYEFYRSIILTRYLYNVTHDCSIYPVHGALQCFDSFWVPLVVSRAVYLFGFVDCACISNFFCSMFPYDNESLMHYSTKKTRNHHFIFWFLERRPTTAQFVWKFLRLCIRVATFYTCCGPCSHRRGNNKIELFNLLLVSVWTLLWCAPPLFSVGSADTDQLNHC